jgi:nucleoside-diphosphate-sugar epimerase
MKVCVFGGAGFLGRRIIRRFAAYGHEAVSLDIDPANHFADLGSQVQSARCDVTEFENVVEAVAKHRPDIVVILGFMRENFPRVAMKLNVYGVDNCLEASRLFGVGRVLLCSSIAVNGAQRFYGDRPVTEADQVTPTKQYAVHKVFNEWQAREYREKHGMSVITIRPGNVSGTDKLIGSVEHCSIIVRPAMGEKLVVDYRDRMRSVIHGDDAAEAFVRIGLADKPKHTIYNTGGEAFSMGRLAELVKRHIPDADISFQHETGGEERSTAYLLDNTLLRDEFGLTFMPYEQRIPLMIDAVRRGDPLG